MNKDIIKFVEKELKKNFEEIDKEELLGLISKLRKYGLKWEEQPEIVEEMLKTHYLIFKEFSRDEIEFGDDKFKYKAEAIKDIITDKSKPMNYLIEGDNLHALYVLKNTHKGKIDVIYIDPPYNTGKNDFVYNDKFVGEDDEYRHSKWLSFMAKRLRIARQLLSEQGIIFISIDNNEMAQLKLLCDDIFGEDNFITILIWINKKSGRQIKKFFADTNKYVLCYAKNSSNFILNYEKSNDEEMIKKYNKKDDISRFKRGFPLYNGNSKFNIDTRPNLVYSIYYNPITKECIAIDEKEKINGKLFLSEENKLGKEFIKIIPPIRTTNKKRGCWRWLIDKFMNEYKQNIIIEQNKKGEWMVYTKDRLNNNNEKVFKPKNIIENISGIMGTQESFNIFNKKVFEHPKPVKLIKWLIDRHPNKNAIVLDFFAGSGTTGQAVLELNKEDGGNRQFILCTNNEVNLNKKKEKELVEYFERNDIKKGDPEYEAVGICQRITYERLKKVILGYIDSKGREVEGLGGNLKYLQTDFVSKLADIDDIKIKLSDKCFDVLLMKENVHDEVFRNENYKIYQNEKKIVAIYNKRIRYSVLDEIKQKLLSCKDKKKILYVKSNTITNDKKISELKDSGIEVNIIPDDIITL